MTGSGLRRDRRRPARRSSATSPTTAGRRTRLRSRLYRAEAAASSRGRRARPAGSAAAATALSATDAAVMIHVVTVHFQDERWIDAAAPVPRPLPAGGAPRLRRAERHRPGARRAVLLRGRPRGQAPREAEPARRGRAGAGATRDDLLLFVDGDAFPIAPVDSRDPRRDSRSRRSGATRTPATASPTRASASPPSASGSTIGGDWRRGHKWTASTGDQVTDVGGNLLGILRGGRHPVASAAAVEPHRPRPALLRRLRRRRVPPRRRVPRAAGPALARLPSRAQVRDEATVGTLDARPRARPGRAVGALPPRRSAGTAAASPTPRSPRSSSPTRCSLSIETDDEFYRRFTT